MPRTGCDLRPFFSIATLVVLVLFSACNQNEPPKNTQNDKRTGKERNPAESSDVLSLTAEAFTKEFIGVDAGRKGNEKYKGKKLGLTGEVWRVRGQLPGRPGWESRTGRWSSSCNPRETPIRFVRNTFFSALSCRNTRPRD